MTPKEIFDILKQCANFELEKEDWGIHAWGAINACPECKDMSEAFYCAIHYPNAVKKLESLPWTMIVKSPHNPQDGEYPTEDGTYITMMDCNEHEVCTNTFKDGSFTWMNRTHIKWWMKLPDTTGIV